MKMRIKYPAILFALLTLSMSVFAQDLRSRDDGGPRPEENVIIGVSPEITTTSAPTTVGFDYGDGTVDNGSDLDTEEGSTQDEIGSKGVVLEVDEIRIYPNPASEYLHINFRTELAVTVSLLNILGQQAYTEDVDARQVSIFVGDLKPGIYFVNIQAGEERIVRKIKISH